jgi:hypothetical protein
LGNSGRRFLSRVQETPQLSHKYPGVLAVEKTRQVDLHFPWIGIFVFELIEYELGDNIVLHAEELTNSLADPWL